jgi:CheY-like chemotaxis protein
VASPSAATTRARAGEVLDEIEVVHAEVRNDVFGLCRGSDALDRDRFDARCAARAKALPEGPDHGVEAFRMADEQTTLRLSKTGKTSVCEHPACFAHTWCERLLHEDYLARVKRETGERNVEPRRRGDHEDVDLVDEILRLRKPGDAPARERRRAYGIDVSTDFETGREIAEYASVQATHAAKAEDTDRNAGHDSLYLLFSVPIKGTRISQPCPHRAPQEPRDLAAVSRPRGFCMESNPATFDRQSVRRFDRFFPSFLLGFRATSRRSPLARAVQASAVEVLMSSTTMKAVHPRPARVFLAEDDDEMRTLLGGALRQDGYEVVEARDGGEMLERVRIAYQNPEDAPDVIVMDVRMPKLSGLGLLSAIRRARWSTPVILITGFGDSVLHEQAQSLGATVVFDKPFDVDDLRTAVLNVSSVRETVTPSDLAG